MCNNFSNTTEASARLCECRESGERNSSPKQQQGKSHHIGFQPLTQYNALRAKEKIEPRNEKQYMDKRND
jgi:hypothetical protein